MSKNPHYRAGLMALSFALLPWRRWYHVLPAQMS